MMSTPIRYQTILYDVQDAVATLTLNRPEKLNAYIPEMGAELVAAFARARQDEAVRVVILTGAGRGFCSGVDLEYLEASFARDGQDSKSPKLGEEDFVRKLPLELQEYPKPLIAAINGHAIGVGITMVLPFDIRIAAEPAKIGFTFTKLGMLPGLGSTHLLPRLVGIARAQELVLTARVILAPEAAEMGLVNRVVPVDSLMKEARELALQIAAHAPEVLMRARQGLIQGASLEMAEAMQNERRLSGELRKRRKSD